MLTIVSSCFGKPQRDDFMRQGVRLSVFSSDGCRRKPGGWSRFEFYSSALGPCVTASRAGAVSADTMGIGMSGPHPQPGHQARPMVAHLQGVDSRSFKGG
jgi:hypothetical protein